MIVKPRDTFDGVLNNGWIFKFYKSKQYVCNIEDTIYYVECDGTDVPFDELDFEESFKRIK